MIVSLFGKNKAENKKDPKGRIPELDILRGIAVLLMILDHFMYDLWGLMPSFFPGFGGSAAAGFARFYWNSGARAIVRQLVLIVFMVLTGICCSFSRSNLKRGLRLAAVALLLTLATYIVGIVISDRNMTITFGVLHCIALALILRGLLEGLIKTKWFYLAAGAVSVCVGLYFYPGVYAEYGTEGIFSLLWKQIVGLCYCGSDSFPFLLYGGEIFIGVFLGKLLYGRERKSLFKNAEYKNNAIEFIGRNSLWIYFGHQLVIPVVLFIIILLSGYKVNL